MSEQSVAPARPSATVVLFRERDARGLGEVQREAALVRVRGQEERARLVRYIID